MTAVALSVLQVSRDALVAELRRELHESNLAVSEARSLLSAGQRQERELRERAERLQRALDNGGVLRAKNIQMAHGAEQELQVLSSQYETLQRQYKVSQSQLPVVGRGGGAHGAEQVLCSQYETLQ